MHLRLLGRPALIRADGKEHPLSAKDSALLALLARRGAAERHLLAELMWPGSPPRKARASLRQRDFRLRQLAGCTLVDKGARMTLAADVRHDLVDPLHRLSGDPWALAEPLLAGQEFDDAPDLAQAVESERRRWREEIREALMRLIAQREASGEIAGAIACARRLVTEESTSEHAARMLMRLHHRRGDRAAALQAFEALKQQLFDALREAPANETVQLAREIDSGHVAAAPPVAALPLALRHPPATLGRAALLSVAQRRLLDRLPVLLVGPAGIGKTRGFDDLVEALVPAVVCRLSAEHRDHPFALPRQLAAALLPMLPAAPGGKDVALLQWLAMPGDAPSPGVVSAARLHQSFCAVLAGIGRADLRVVAIDDLHFAGEECVAWLARLLADGPHLPWLLTCRDQAIPPPLAAWLDGQPTGDEAQFDLAPLAQVDLAPLLESVLVPGADLAAWSAALGDHCGGHPLSVLQVLRALHAQGQLEAARPPAALPVPREAMQRVARRLERCDPRTQSLAYVAALCGDDFSVEVAGRVLPASAIDLVAPWRELQALGLVREQAYTHELVRQAVVEMVPDALAAAIHADIGLALHALGGVPARRVRHWEAAGRWADAGRDAAAVAAEALAVGLRSAARQRWLQAATHFERIGHAADAFEARALALPLTLSSVSAQQAMTEAQTLCTQAQTPRQRCMASIALAQVKSELHDPAGRMHALEALAQAERMGDAQLRARAALRVAVAHHVQGDHREGLAMLAAVRADRQLLSSLERQEYQDAEALMLAATGQRRQAAARFMRAYRQAEADSDLATTADHAGNAAIQLGYLCKPDLALKLADAALALDGRTGAALGFSAVNAMTVAGLCTDLGRYTRALKIGQECLDALRRSGLAHFTISAEHTLASIYLQLGRPDLAHALLADAPADAPAWARALRRSAQGGLARARGQSPLPAACEARQMLAELGSLYSGYLRCRIELEEARWTDDAGQAIKVARRCIAWAMANEHVALERPARLVEIEGLLRLGRHNAAADCADALAAGCASGWTSYNFYLPELWWCLVQAWSAAGRDTDANDMTRHAARWIHTRAALDVPAVFRTSFLQRNAANLSLLGRAATLGQ